MKKTIKSLLITYIFPIALIIYISITLFDIYNVPNSKNNPKKLKYKNQTVNIYISDTDDVYIKQEIKLKSNFKNYPEIKYYSIPIPYYLSNYYWESIDFSSNIDSINYSERGNNVILQITDKNINDILQKNNYTISLSYKISSDSFLYLNKKDSSILLTIDTDNYFPNTNLYIHLPEKTNILNNNILFSKINNTTYKINNIPFSIFNALSLNDEINAFNIKIENNLLCSISKYTDNTFPFLIFYIRIAILLISLSIAIIVVIARLKNVVFISKGLYERNTDGVIDPVSAESIIDGKIDVKDLIMTCITNLLYKKNLKLINETSVELISTDNITELEKEILLVFGNIEIGKIYNFSELKIFFKNDNEFTLDFNEKLLNIKKIIKEKLIKSHIINKNWTNLMYTSKKISIFLLVNTLILFSYAIIFFYDALITMFFLEIIFIYFLSKSPKNIILYQDSIRNKNKFITALFISTSIIQIIFSFINYTAIQKIVFLIPIIINLFSIKFSNTFVLTHTGKIEYARALKLKRYIIDYSLIQERDLDGINIWDEYLVYATAFGIPNNITKKMYESLMNLNITLQVFDSFH